jgi:hypothetical protein
MTTQKNIRLKVTGYDKETKLFKVEFEDREYQVRQTGHELPEHLHCRITQNDDEIEVGPEIEQYFHSGAIRRFTVRSDMRESAGVYELVDECGFVVYLYGAEEYSFFKGKQLLCTVISTEGARPYVTLRENLEVTGSAFSISKEYLKGLFAEREWAIDSLCDLVLYDGMDDPFDVKCYEWVIAQTSIYNDQNALEDFLSDVRGCCMDVMEKTELLSRCAQDEVSVLLDRMTMIIEHMGYVKTALQTIAKEEEDKYIDDLFYKLTNSGFLYHPTKHFCVATYLFRIKPDLMSRKVGELFNMVRSHDLHHWKKEPFRTELIKQLETYIKRNEVEVCESPDNQELYYRGFQALAMQLLLADEDEDLIDVQLNRSMMYRYASHLQFANKRRMADMSLNALQGLYRKRAGYGLQDTATPDKLYYFLDNWGRSQEVDRTRKAVYRSKDLVLRIEDGKITISPDVDQTLKSALYEDIPLWHGLDIMLERQHATAPYRSKGSDLMQCNAKLWQKVEKSLFETERVVKQKETKVKSIPEVGDYTFAYVYGQDEEEPNKFYCRIDDEESGFVGEGVIYVRSEEGEPGIVTYFPNPTVGNFADSEGNPYRLEMKVVAKTEDNVCIMDMKELLNDYILENKPDFHLDCEVGKVLTDCTFLAVSKDGMPVYATFSPLEASLEQGDHIKVLLKDRNRWFANGFVQAEYSCRSENDFTLNDAFATLIASLSYGVQEPDRHAEEQNEVMMERSHVVELLNIIDEVASVEDDIHVSYNYLGFAKMISRMIGAQTRERSYEGLMEVAQMLHKFAVTNDVDDEKLRNLQVVNKDLLKSNYNLRCQFNRLLAVSYMGGENNDWLINMSKNDADEGLRKLASLVYSFNVLNAAGLETDELKQAIKELLKLRGRDAYFKVYDKGEGEDTEFKTSIVFPPGSMRPDIEKQTRNIMKEICAFLNHKGGTLYLGVNDAGGGEGLEEDMKHELFRDSRDKYDNYVRNQIVLQLGQEASHCVVGTFDDDARGRDVYILKIDPCEHPVKLAGKYYQRQGSSSRQVDKTYLDTFLRNRPTEYRQLMKERGIEVPEAVVGQKVADVVKSEQDVVPAAQDPQQKIARVTAIATSTLRDNTLHDYEEPAEYAQAYIHFMENAKYMMERMDNYQEDQYLLTLAVRESELDGYMILVYDDATVCKVPMNRILDKEESKVYSRYAGAKLLFASPVRSGDVLYQAYESKGETYHRFQSVDDIKETNIGESGDALFDVVFDRLVKNDVVPKEHIDELPKRITDRKRIGYTTAKKDGAKCSKAIAKLGL